MNDLLRSWHLWEEVLKGASVDTFDTAWLLEDPDEYQLRRLLRTFDQRDELLHRFGSYIFDAPPVLGPDEVATLGREFLGELQRLATVLELPDAASSAASAAVTIRPERSERPQWCTSYAILEALGDQMRMSRRGATGGRNLAEIAYGTSGNDPWTQNYLIAPLSDFETNLGPHVALAKSGCHVWLDGEQLVVTEPTVRSSSFPNRDWNPQLAWPEEADIEQHLEQERQASDPDAAGVVLQAILQSNSTFAVSAAAHHPNLPEQAIVELSNSALIKMRTAAARNPSAPAAVLAQLAQDTDAGVRLGVVVNRNTPKGVIEGFEAEPDPHVLSVVLWSEHATSGTIERAAASDYWRARTAAAEHQRTPPDLLETLANDENSDVRLHVASRDDVPVHILEALASDESPSVRGKVATHQRTPAHVIEVLTLDDNPRVARAIAQRDDAG